MTLPRPTTDQPHYGQHLGDVGYWGAYVRTALDRSDLSATEVEAPFVGTFPTFLAGDVVVKLFGETFDGAACFATELAMAELLTGEPGIPAPGLVASGRLFDDDDHWSWPYLIMERLHSVPIRDARSAPSVPAAAAELGAVITRLHRLPIPALIAARDPLPGLRAAAPERLRGFGLPDHLVEQVPEFLADASAERVLVHADLTADHVFVDDHGLAGIIDWADAIPADPWYELVATRFDAFAGDPRPFSIMLDAAGWTRGPDFPRRALQGVLEFQFNAITAITELVELPRIATLDDLADALFG
ncbi:phosphotransferase family protein [Microlunatus parietis]|uniref:Aminoglycoside phosphotransferase n=1 Tax=Microlunatus parietis TaxID=682979 RepID=A0A7Y9LCT3_9ACTN|nr:aminoglycoside phosphotransferase family protein [Microlunatus parietis]NYE71251.1 aminoglycoside phosphotransferase [Microlunatus parietis]